ncbi:GNAT family N-acetyltransferase [Kineosporia sp. J2-2]|uniref:GNAT family N-acetyltransferase n=1 Tax=Kineosporia corallincola TaxID=2835133 RepID=A0ABS5TCE7_9ACTN|nr:GNAT family N-acetyltransferase [Kineosporia corallincola]MBT0768753.1 GNAT family N-acetyltransferase [Kineosporia corallincola]
MTPDNAGSADGAARGPEITAASPHDIPDLARLAAETFPLACPPHMTSQAVSGFIAEQLSEAAFGKHLADPNCDVSIARPGSPQAETPQPGTPQPGTPDGYALTLFQPAPPEIARLIGTTERVTYLSKLYVRPGAHGGGIGRALLARVREQAHHRGSRLIWLGTNQLNTSAQRFYERTGFEQVGVRQFLVGGVLENDFVYALREPR